MLGKFWNYRFLGFFGFFCLFLKKTINLSKDKMSTFAFNYNISKCGKGVIVRRGIVYRYPNHIEVSDNVEIGESVSLTSEIQGGRLIVKKNVVIGRFSKLDFSGNILIGENSLMSENVLIQTHDHGLDPRSKPVGKSITIGKNVWIGMNVIILSNCFSIGDNSIIGAGSVVTSNVEPNSIYVGNPAKFLRKI